MSRLFQAGNQVLWSPSNSVAELFVRSAEAIAPVVGRPTGIGRMVADEYNLELDTFTAFVEALVQQYLASTHPILRSLLEGLTATALVLVHRAGRAIPALNDPPAAHLSDVSVSTAGISPPGDPVRLRRLAEEHSRSMDH